MSKDEIIKSELWKHLQKFSMTERNAALFGEYKPRIEKEFDVKIERWAYTQLNSIKDDMASIAITDPYMNRSEIAVFIPNAKHV